MHNYMQTRGKIYENFLKKKLAPHTSNILKHFTEDFILLNDIFWYEFLSSGVDYE